MARKKEQQTNEYGLTQKQENYCQQYVLCGNQSAAYRIAFDAEVSNVNTVAVEACKLHSNPNITQRIEDIRKEAYSRNKIAIDEIIHTLAGMVRFDPAELYTDEGSLKPLKEIPKPARQMISQLDVDELYQFIDKERVLVGHTKKIRLYNKLDAIEKLMKHLGGYEKDNEQKAQAHVVVNLGGGVAPEATEK